MGSRQQNNQDDQEVFLTSLCHETSASNRISLRVEATTDSFVTGIWAIAHFPKPVVTLGGTTQLFSTSKHYLRGYL